MRIVVQHPALLVVVGRYQAQFHHQLAAVAHTERQCVGARIEPVESLLCLGVEEESARPALGRAQHIAVGEASAEHNHADVVERFAAADEVGHHHILDVEARKVKRIGHLALAVGAFLAYDGSFDAGRRAPVGADAIRRHESGEAVVEAQLQRLLLVVGVTPVGTTVHALVAVEQV